MSIPVIFDWEVPKKGFSIVDGFTAEIGDQDDGLSIEIQPHSILVPKTSEMKKTKPLDHGGLFRTFATTETTPEGVLLFAKKYGFLGTHQTGIHFEEGDASYALTAFMESGRDGEALEKALTEKPSDAFGEPVQDWFILIRQMRRILRLFDNLEDFAPKCVRWKGYKEVWFDIPDLDNTLIASDEVNPELLSELRPGDPIGPAMVWLLSYINAEIKKTTPKLSIIGGRPQTYISPSSLLEAMWLQFSIAITEEKQHRACEHCGDYFEIGTGRGQKTKKFCSESCRVMAHRKKNQ